MGNSKQEDLEKFVVEDVGIQIANLRYHLASSLKEDDGGEPAISIEGFRMIDALLERLLNKVKSLKNNLPPESDTVRRDLVVGTIVPLRGKGLSNSADDHGISSVLDLLDQI